MYFPYFRYFRGLSFCKRLQEMHNFMKESLWLCFLIFDHIQIDDVIFVISIKVSLLNLFPDLSKWARNVDSNRRSSMVIFPSPLLPLRQFSRHSDCLRRAARVRCSGSSRLSGYALSVFWQHPCKY